MVLFPQRTVPKFPMVSKGQQREIIIIKKMIYKKSSFDSGSATCLMLQDFFIFLLMSLCRLILPFASRAPGVSFTVCGLPSK